jgi:nucleotide-binding universal stress UspA family protein
MYKRILVPLDGSELTECSLDHVKEIALGCHVPEVILLAIIQPDEESIPSFWGGIAGKQTRMEAGRGQATTAVVDFKQMTSEWKEEELEKKQQAVADDYLCRVAERLIKAGMNVQTAVMCGKLAEAIVDFANKNDIDLIVMTTHQRGDNPLWDIGNAADKVIRSSNIPVLVAVPKGCRL